MILQNGRLKFLNPTKQTHREKKEKRENRFSFYSNIY